MESKIVGGVFGAVGASVFGFMYGEGPVVTYGMLSLLMFIVLDWISGYRAAKKDNTYASKYGIDGVFRTFFMLLLPVGGHFMDMAFGLSPYAFGTLAGGLLVHTINSTSANAIRAGWGSWVPDSILTKIAGWVSSEIESKSQRAAKRQAEIGGNVDNATEK